MMKMEDDIELQLLVIDLGDSCVVKVESGMVFLSSVLPTIRMFNGVGIYTGGFDQIRAAVDALADGEKPVPRIETNEDGYWYRIIHTNERQCPDSIDRKSFQALNEIVGVPLPVWSPRKGEWVKLLPISSPIAYAQQIFTEIQESISVEIWRYTLRRA